MVTRAAIEKRLAAIEAKTKPKRIETLADWVLFIANRKPGQPWPPVNPVLEEGLHAMMINGDARVAAEAVGNFAKLVENHTR